MKAWRKKTSSNLDAVETEFGFSLPALRVAYFPRFTFFPMGNQLIRGQLWPREQDTLKAVQAFLLLFLLNLIRRKEITMTGHIGEFIVLLRTNPSVGHLKWVQRRVFLEVAFQRSIPLRIFPFVRFGDACTAFETPDNSAFSIV